MLYLTEEDVVRHLDMRRAIELVRASFMGIRDGNVLNHPRRRLALPAGSVLHYMAAGDARYFGAKIYSTNPKSGAHFVVLLYRAEDGVPLAMIEARQLGQIRTGAASAVATDVLARTNAKVLGIVGTGFQAMSQVVAVAAVRDLTEVRVWSRDAEKRERFADQLSSKITADVVIASGAEEALVGADIVITATNAKDPVLEAQWIGPGTHVNAVGSNWAKRRELPGEVLSRAAVVAVDSLEVAVYESGDLLLARAEGSWDGGNLVAFKDVLRGKSGRKTAEDVTVFKSNGLAAEDIAVAGWVYERAVEAGAQRDLPTTEPRLSRSGT